MRLIAALLILTALAGCRNLEETVVGASAVDLQAALSAAPPTDAPALFAPGVVNRGLPTRDMAVAPGGGHLVWCELVGNFHRAVLIEAVRADGVWSEPRVVPFAADPRWKTFEPAFSPDGSRLFFVSDRPESGVGDPEEHNAIWVAERTADGWGAPSRLPDTVNDGDTFFPSVTRDGTLYLTRDLEGGVSAVFRSRLVDGIHQAAELLPDAVNAGRTRFNAMVDPDDRFLIVPIFGLEDSRGGVDYYLVARNEDDTWEDPVNMGDLVNGASRQDWSPALSPDGRAFFFMSDRGDPTQTPPAVFTRETLLEQHNAPGNGQVGTWWIDARAVEVLRPYVSGPQH